MIRTMLLASAFMTLALPCRAEDVDPHCALYGEGFVWAEATGSCIKISGDVRANYRFGSGDSGFGSEGGLSLDARKDTELGPFRAFVEPRFKGN